MFVLLAFGSCALLPWLELAACASVENPAVARVIGRTRVLLSQFRVFLWIMATDTDVCAVDTPGTLVLTFTFDNIPSL